jgi:hypothetical protein
MAGYTEQFKSSTPEFNPNKRSQEGEHPDGMQIEETPIYETITDEEIATMECDEDDEDYSLGRDEIRKTNKKQKKAATANSSNTQGPFLAIKKVTAKAYTFAAGFRTIPSSEPVNPYKALIPKAQGQTKTPEGTDNPFKDIIQHNTQGRTKTPEGISDPVKDFLEQSSQSSPKTLAGSTKEGTTPTSTQATIHKPPPRRPSNPKQPAMTPILEVDPANPPAPNNQD